MLRFLCLFSKSSEGDLLRLRSLREEEDLLRGLCLWPPLESALSYRLRDELSGGVLERSRRRSLFD